MTSMQQIALGISMNTLGKDIRHSMNMRHSIRHLNRKLVKASPEREVEAKERP